MTREPLHYWRRRRGMSLGAYIHNARLKRTYNPWRDILWSPFGDSPLFDSLKKSPPTSGYPICCMFCGKQALGPGHIPCGDLATCGWTLHEQRVSA
jgi:hypothetical protein